MKSEHKNQRNISLGTEFKYLFMYSLYVYEYIYTCMHAPVLVYVYMDTLMHTPGSIHYYSGMLYYSLHMSLCQGLSLSPGLECSQTGRQALARVRGCAGWGTWLLHGYCYPNLLPPHNCTASSLNR